MIFNRQRAVPVSLASLERFEERLRRALRLPEDSLSICLVSESRMARWNRLYRSKRGPTDVLSFPAFARRGGLRRGRPGVEMGDHPPSPRPGGLRRTGRVGSSSERLRAGRPHHRGDSPGHGEAGAGVANLKFEISEGSYLGDIAIAPAVARRNAKRLGRNLSRELRVLVLHGALHLLGYDHERDHGEMDGIERRLRRQLGLGPGRAWRKAKTSC